MADIYINDDVWWFDSDDCLRKGKVRTFIEGFVGIRENARPDISTGVPINRCFLTKEECITDRENRINRQKDKYADKLTNIEELVKFLYGKMKETEFPDIPALRAVEEKAKDFLDLDLLAEEDKLSDKGDMEMD